MPLVSHLGHPERAFEIMFTPHLSSAMAIFGFVYLWYLMAVLLLEVWFDYRKDIVELTKRTRGPVRWLYNILTLGVKDVSPKALAFDDKAGRFITIIGIPSAVLLHGYVGFIFGSLKGNPWWSSVLMPIIFLLSAIVSGISVVLLLYYITTRWRGRKLDMSCVDAIGRYLMFALIFDLTIELLDIVHRLYEAGESIEVLRLLSSGYLYETIFVAQLFVGGLLPLAMLGYVNLFRTDPRLRAVVCFVCSILALVGVLFMRWNVVIGGQLFSKSLQGLTTYKLEFVGKEGSLFALILLTLPFIILFVLTKLLPPWPDQELQDKTELVGSESLNPA